MAGIEYADLATPVGNVESFTYSLAVRMYF